MTGGGRAKLAGEGRGLAVGSELHVHVDVGIDNVLYIRHLSLDLFLFVYSRCIYM